MGIFFYVGVEVGLASIAVNYFKTQGMSSLKTASFLVSLYWFGALVGRLLGSWILTKVKSGKLVSIFGICRRGDDHHFNVYVRQRGDLVACAVRVPEFDHVPEHLYAGDCRIGTDDQQGLGADYDAVVGGAVIPYLIGALADKVGSIQHAFIIPVICYLYIAYYGMWGSKPTRTVA